MEEILKNPIIVQLELGLIEDIIKVIGSAIHNRFSHDEVDAVKQRIIAKAQEAVKKSSEPSVTE